jgi:DNA-binding transcriptional regulator/RsmH inhibitor MraZ
MPVKKVWMLPVVCWLRLNCASLLNLRNRSGWSGQGSHFEIWSDAGWQKQQEAVFALGDQFLPPGLEDLAL